MKKEDLNLLEDNNFFKMLETATNGYVVGLSSKKIKVFSQISKKYNLTLKDWGCNTCIISNIKSIGKIAIPDIVEETKPKKAGRPKKYTKTN